MTWRCKWWSRAVNIDWRCWITVSAVEFGEARSVTVGQLWWTREGRLRKSGNQRRITALYRHRETHIRTILMHRDTLQTTGVNLGMQQWYHFFRTDAIRTILSVCRYRSDSIPAQSSLNQCRISIPPRGDLIITLLSVKNNILNTDNFIWMKNKKYIIIIYDKYYYKLG